MCTDPQSCRSCGGLLLSLRPLDCSCLAGLWDDEHSLGTSLGSSSALSISSVPGSSSLCDSEEGKCLPDSLPLSSNFSSNTACSTSKYLHAAFWKVHQQVQQHLWLYWSWPHLSYAKWICPYLAPGSPHVGPLWQMLQSWTFGCG